MTRMQSVLVTAFLLSIVASPILTTNTAASDWGWFRAAADFSHTMVKSAAVSTRTIATGQAGHPFCPGSADGAARLVELDTCFISHTLGPRRSAWRQVRTVPPWPGG